MKTLMDEESKKALVTYRIERAYATLKEAEVMRRESFCNAAVNRMYYACYYAAVALLLKHDLSTQTHNGVTSSTLVCRYACRNALNHFLFVGTILSLLSFSSIPAIGIIF